MNSHIKSWLTSLILTCKSIRIQNHICFSEGKLLIVQSNHYPLFAVSSLSALRLLCCCCWVASWLLGWDSSLWVLQRIALQGGHGGPFKHMMDVTGIKIFPACLAAMKETLETFKLREYQRDQPQGHYPKEQ